MSYLTTEKKANIFTEYGFAVANTGSIEAQVAMLTERINHISDHLKTNKKDFSTQRGLMQMVGKRKRLLTYLSKHNLSVYRLFDRALRPLFPEDYVCEVQVLVSLISSDAEVMPDALACLAASAALAVSDIPIQEIISEVRIGRVNGKMIVNPTRSELTEADMEFMIAATAKNIMMVEGGSKECQEEDLIAAIQLAHQAIQVQVKAQEELRDKVGVTAKREYPQPYRNEELHKKINEFAEKGIKEIAASASAKQDRSDAFEKLKDDLIEHLGVLPDEDVPLVKYY